jgi:Uma2 family endonuclease
MSIAEFLDWDDGTDTRYELVHGVPMAMAPTLLDHAAIVASLVREFGNRLRSPCRLLAEVGVGIPHRDDSFYVADLAVVCSGWGRGDRYLTEPVVLVEVLSPTTEGHDRGTKVPAYRTVSSVHEIVLVSTAAVAAEVWRRTDEGWFIEDVVGPRATLRLPSVGVEVPLASVYEGIALEQTPGDVAGAG